MPCWVPHPPRAHGLTLLLPLPRPPPGKFVFSVKDTMQCLEMGAVETLLVWEALDCDRYELMHPGTQKMEVKLLNSEQVGGPYGVSPLWLCVVWCVGSCCAWQSAK